MPITFLRSAAVAVALFASVLVSIGGVSAQTVDVCVPSFKDWPNIICGEVRRGGQERPAADQIDGAAIPDVQPIGAPGLSDGDGATALPPSPDDLRQGLKARPDDPTPPPAPDEQPACEPSFNGGGPCVGDGSSGGDEPTDGGGVVTDPVDCTPSFSNPQPCSGGGGSEDPPQTGGDQGGKTPDQICVGGIGCGTPPGTGPDPVPDTGDQSGNGADCTPGFDNSGPCLTDGTPDSGGEPSGPSQEPQEPQQPPPPPPPVVNQAGYCANTPSDVACSASNNFDSAYANQGLKTNTIFAGSVLSIPGSLVDSQTGEGVFLYSSSDVQQGYRMRVWFSTTPGGATLSPATGASFCSRSFAPEGGSMVWTQDPSNNGIACYVGSEAGTIYLNHEMICNSGAFSDCDADNPYRLNRNLNVKIGLDSRSQ